MMKTTYCKKEEEGRGIAVLYWFITVEIVYSIDSYWKFTHVQNFFSTEFPLEIFLMCNFYIFLLLRHCY